MKTRKFVFFMLQLNERQEITMKKFSEKDITIANADCIEFAKKMENESVDLIITSPPYCMQKAYEDLKADLVTFKDNNSLILSEAIRVLKKGGSLCWQVGYHVKDNVVVPLDIIIYNIIECLNKSLPDDCKLILRNRIIWTFGHGLHTENRFSGRHETILWFTKGTNTTFNLDCVRIPQKYPGKTYFKGKRKGQISGNPKGKNPSDVWDIPNVKSNHVEKTEHPCQFPEALAQRLVLALSNEGDLVYDPYSGSGTTALAAYLNGRRFVGTELDKTYFSISTKRLKSAFEGDIRIREDKPVMKPDPKSKVAQKPKNFI